MNLLLALDTATATASVAVYHLEKEVLLAETPGRRAAAIPKS